VSKWSKDFALLSPGRCRLRVAKVLRSSAKSQCYQQHCLGGATNSHATGCGKTGVAVLASYALSATRVLVIMPSIIISRQICQAYHQYLLKLEIISPEDDHHE